MISIKYIVYLVLAISIFLGGSSLALAGEVVTETVSFRSGNDNVSAYLARPAGKGPYPALVVVHEWWGLNDWIKENARSFAERGYVALAVDLYRGKVAVEPTLAQELSSSLPADRALRDMEAALDFVRSRPFVNAEKIGSIGWCMGGGYSLQLALNADLAATVIAYGRLVTDAALIANLHSPILGIFADQDRVIPPSSVREFEKALDAQGVRNTILIYEGVGHAFMNPNNKAVYGAKQAAEAWQEIYAFFNRYL